MTESDDHDPNLWLRIGKDLQRLATLRGGPLDLYKPFIRIEIFEHDDYVHVQVGRCKSLDELVFSRSSVEGDWAARLWADRDAERSRRHGKGRSHAASRRRARRGNTADPVPLDFGLVTKIAEELQRGYPRQEP